MAKKVRTVLKLQIPAGQANPAPPVGTALGPHGINIMDFCKAYNEQTRAQAGQIIPAVVTIYEDRSFSFITKTPPASDLLRKAAGVDKGASHQLQEVAGQVSRAQVRQNRRDQADRPEHHRHRAGDAHRRRHRALNGDRGAGMSKLGKRTREAREDVDRMKQYAVSEAIGLVKQKRDRQVRRDRGAAPQDRPRRPPR